MFNNTSGVRTLILLLAAFVFSGCSEPQQQGGAAAGKRDAVLLNVYKSPTCLCCEDWVDHAESHGFKAEIHHPPGLSRVKEELGIAAPYRACHTAVTADGFVFEGHVPARFIHQFLEEQPDGALGLAVPGMPVGSPGMEMGERFTPYQVLLLRADGSSRVYAEVNSAQAQYP